ncbi:MAG: ParB/RepB/Spo0J family partition protein [bacterium]
MSKFELNKPLSWFGDNNEQDKAVKTEIEIDKIRIVYTQPRENMGGEEFDELVNSIRTHGLLEPIVIKQDGDNYNLICGERRLSAFKQLELKTITANIRNDIKDEDIFIIQIIENLHRKDLEPIELAKAYQRLLDKYGNTEDVAKLVKKSKTHVCDMLSLLNIENDLKGKITKNNVRKAIEVLRIKDDDIKNKAIKDFDDIHIKDIHNRKNMSSSSETVNALVRDFNNNRQTKISVSYLKRFTRIDLKIPSGFNSEKIIKQILKIKEN